jgi:hypothetical protein
MSKRKAEYIEGEKARKNFERLATALFQVPKKGKPQAKRRPKPRRSSGSGKG